MSPITCPFCEQVNPAQAKFCYACGGALHLAPCPRCGAVSNVSATTCYQCNSPLRGRKGDTDPAPPVVEAPKPLPGRRPAAVIAAAAFAVIVVMGYFGYRQSSPIEVPQPAAESSGRPADGAPDKSDEAAQAASAAAAPPETPVADRAPAEDTKSPADGGAKESRRANAAAGVIGRFRPAAAGNGASHAPPRKEVCTQPAEALGLCTMTAEEKKLAEAVPALKAASARPESIDPGKAGTQEAPRGEPCTKAVAALGLCTPASQQRR